MINNAVFHRDLFSAKKNNCLLLLSRKNERKNCKSSHTPRHLILHVYVLTTKLFSCFVDKLSMLYTYSTIPKAKFT